MLACRGKTKNKKRMGKGVHKLLVKERMGKIFREHAKGKEVGWQGL